MSERTCGWTLRGQRLAASAAIILFVGCGGEASEETADLIREVAKVTDSLIWPVETPSGQSGTLIILETGPEGVRAPVVQEVSSSKARHCASIVVHGRPDEEGLAGVTLGLGEFGGTIDVVAEGSDPASAEGSAAFQATGTFDLVTRERVRTRVVGGSPTVFEAAGTRLKLEPRIAVSLRSSLTDPVVTADAESGRPQAERTFWLAFGPEEMQLKLDNQWRDGGVEAFGLQPTSTHLGR